MLFHLTEFQHPGKIWPILLREDWHLGCQIYSRE